MDKDKLEKMLHKEYNINLSGSTIGYLLMLLSEKQHELNKKARDNITDVMAHMSAGANDVVGNLLIHEAYRVAGAEFLAFSLDTDAATIGELMEAKTEEEFKKVDGKLRAMGRGTGRTPRGTKLN